MKISDLLVLCFRNLFRRKMRTFLTVIGVVIGTCSIVIMISLGVGLNETQEQQMAQWMDLSMIQVYQGQKNEPGKESVSITDDAVAYMKSIPHVEAVSPILPLYSEVSVTSGRFTYSGQIVGMNIKELERMGYNIIDGRFLTANDDKYSILVGQNTAYSFYNERSQKFYNPTDEEGNPLPPPIDIFKAPISLQLRMENQDGGEGVTQTPSTSGAQKKLKVTGQLKEDWGKDAATYDGIFIDIELAKKLKEDYNRLNNVKEKFKGYDQVKVKVDDFRNVEEVEKALKELNYETYSATQNLEMAKKQSRTIQLVLGCLGSISMLVAAIGISNTMVMSIYERTREIGIMKVLGCELKNIRAMFLLEAGAIGLLGGIIGLILSYTLSIVANMVAGGMMGGMTGGMADGEVVSKLSIIPPWLALLGILFSIAVGVVSGFLPANRAVKVSALTAIKQD